MPDDLIVEAYALICLQILWPAEGSFLEVILSPYPIPLRPVCSKNIHGLPLQIRRRVE